MPVDSFLIRASHECDGILARKLLKGVFVNNSTILLIYANRKTSSQDRPLAFHAVWIYENNLLF